MKKVLFMKIPFIFFIIMANGIFMGFSLLAQQDSNSRMDWSELPSLPDTLGLGGAVVGESNNVLLVAGGSNFPTPLWDGGTKHYYSEIYILEKDLSGGYTWRNAGNLPYPVSNGASVNTTNGILTIGGQNDTGDLNKVMMLSWNALEKKVEIDSSYPSLPEACSYLSATILGNQVYVAGGKNKKTDSGMDNFWVLDLSERNSGNFEWKNLPNWPGPPRFGAVLASQSNGEHDCIYLFSGKNGPNNYLLDVYEYNPSIKNSNKQWSQKSDIPDAVMAAQTLSLGQTHILIFSGSDGHDIDKIETLKENYSFTREIKAYHTVTDTWVGFGSMPEGFVTTILVTFDGKWVFPGGEIGPGRRTNKVRTAQLKSQIAKSTFHWIDYLSLGIYLLGITLLGVYFSKEKETGTKNYFLGGGKIPYWAAALSIMATSISSIGFMATPSKSFATNWAYFAGTLTMFIVIPVVVFAFIPFFQRLKVVSAYEYLEARFNVAIRLFAATVYCVFQIVARMSIVLYLPGIALSAVTGMNVYLSILIMGVLSTAYTVLGGMKAVIWTDVIQGFVLVFGAILCILVAIFSLEGSIIPYYTGALKAGKFNMGEVVDWDFTTASLWVVVFGNVFYRLSTYTSDQSIVQRYMVTPSIEKAQKASWTSLFLLVPWSLIVFTLGTTLYIFYKENPGELNPIVNTDAVLPWFISQKMPVGLGGLIIAAIFAAAMSSLDSAMHSTSTVIVTDFYKRFFPRSSDASQLSLAKWLIGIFGIMGTGISLVMAGQNYISIWDVFIEFTGLFGGITAGLFFLGVFTIRGNSSGALVGIVGSIVIMFLVKGYTNIHILLYGAISLITCFLLGYISSLFLRGKSNITDLTIFRNNKE